MLALLGLAGRGDILPVEQQRAGSRRLDQRQLACQRGLAAAGFAHHRQGLAGLQFERYAVERLDLRSRLEKPWATS
jgi:hypothetical protein